MAGIEGQAGVRPVRHVMGELRVVPVLLEGADTHQVAALGLAALGVAGHHVVVELGAGQGPPAPGRPQLETARLPGRGGRPQPVGVDAAAAADATAPGTAVAEVQGHRGFGVPRQHPDRRLDSVLAQP